MSNIKDMYPEKINDCLWLLGNKYFHHYLIVGEKSSALVEMGISATAGLVQEQLWSISTEPDYLIVTHPHSDHITGLDYLKNSFPRATVIAGEGAEAFLSHPKAAHSLIAEDIHMLEALISRGVCPQALAVKKTPSLAGSKVVQDEEELDLGELKIRFLTVRGHSPGNILVHIPSFSTLLVSDSLGNYYPRRGFFPVFFTGFNDYLATIDRLEKENPSILGLAHNGIFTDRREIADIILSAKKAAGDVLYYVSEDKREDEETAKSLFDFYYRDELAIYSPQNILNCCCLLVRRIREIKHSMKRHV
jgi:glyoxylase-like metal-dependent hydrolase (beta-lactamase superfamily II)